MINVLDLRLPSNTIKILEPERETLIDRKTIRAFLDYINRLRERESKRIKGGKRWNTTK